MIGNCLLKESLGNDKLDASTQTQNEFSCHQPFHTYMARNKETDYRNEYSQDKAFSTPVLHNWHTQNSSNNFTEDNSSTENGFVLVCFLFGVPPKFYIKADFDLVLISEGVPQHQSWNIDHNF